MKSSRGEERAASLELDTGVVRGCPVDVATVRPILRVLPRPRVGWADATRTIVAGGNTAELIAEGTDRFGSIEDQAETLFESIEVADVLPKGARPRLYGGFAFTDTHRNLSPDGIWRGYPAGKFVLPAVQCSVTADGTWLTTTAMGPGANERAETRLRQWRSRIESLPELAPAGPPGVGARQYTPSRADWRERIERATDRIEAGQLQKVVLAQSLRVSLKSELAVPDALARLGELYPGCHRFLFDPEEGGAFFGATPERLVTVRGQTVDTEALAGSIGRGDRPEEDEWLATQLRKSEKDRHEHQLVVDAIREQLSPLTTDIDEGDRGIRRLANVQHLRTPIRATLTEGRHVLSLVKALHPTPAVGGRPPETALETISETETFDRGWYAAPIGWFDADGDGTFAVAIRSAITESNEATLFAGAGIVADSDPDEEWDELQLKYRPILDELA